MHFMMTLLLNHQTRRGFPTRMFEAEITGVEEAIGNLTERGAVDPVVKATLTLSESGFVSITDAIAFGEIKDESIAGWFPLPKFV
jgi:hypoxia up-regulated 1